MFSGYIIFLEPNYINYFRAHPGNLVDKINADNAN